MHQFNTSYLSRFSLTFDRAEQVPSHGLQDRLALRQAAPM